MKKNISFIISVFLVLVLGALIAGCGGGGGNTGGAIVTVPTATTAPTNTPTGPTATPVPAGPTSTPTNVPTGPTATPTSTPTGATPTPAGNTPTPGNTPTTAPTNTPTPASGTATVRMIIYKMVSGDQVPQSGGTVSILIPGGTRTGTTGADGSYTFTGVPAGTYDLKFELSGQTPIQYSKSIIPGNQTWTAVFGAPF